MNTFILILAAGFLLFGCDQGISDQQMVSLKADMATAQKEQIIKTIKENPDLVYAALESDKTRLLTLLEEASQERNKNMFLDSVKRSLQAERFTPDLSDNRITFGYPEAPMKIVVYSDYLCHYCEQGEKMIQALLKDRAGKIQVIVKHLPLQDDLSTVAAVYAEALNRIDSQKAKDFHESLYINQGRIFGNPNILFDLVVALGLTSEQMTQFNVLTETEEIQTLILKDQDEAKKLGISGTPAFLIDGILFNGAIPAEWMNEAIDLLKTPEKQAE